MVNFPRKTVVITPEVSPHSSEEISVDYGKLKAILQKDIETFPGTVGLVFYDMKRDEKIEINSDDVFEAASLVKVPIMLDIYLKVSRGELKMEDKIELIDTVKTGGAGILKDKPSGTFWTVKDLVSLMISKSDNTATDMLIDLAGMENVENTVKAMGLKRTTLRRKIYDFAQVDMGRDNVTSPEDMFLLFYNLYNSKDIQEVYRKEMLDILKSQENRKMIPKYLPSESMCAHKTGGLTGIVHDCSIVYPSARQPYILVLMGKNVTDTEKAEDVFANMSRDVYDFVNGEE